MAVNPSVSLTADSSPYTGEPFKNAPHDSFQQTERKSGAAAFLFIPKEDAL